MSERATTRPGRATLLDQLHDGLLALDPGYRIERFGKSFGGLYLTVADRFKEGESGGEFADRGTALTDSAETASERTCETCGGTGRIRLRGDGPRTWMQSSCYACSTLRIRQVAPGDITETSRWNASRPQSVPRTPSSASPHVRPPARRDVRHT